MNIALVADKNYYLPLETLLKSICCHHRDVTFYVLYQDMDQVWFDHMSELVELFNNRLISVKVDFAQFDRYRTLSHISSSTYHRLLAPEIIEGDRVLYLDCDMIVDGDLTPLYHTDMGNYVVGAVQDLYIECVTHKYTFAPEFEHYFNAGVLLIDTARWKEEKITSKALALAARYQEALLYADQDVLNLLFHQQWKMLPREYNVQVAARFALMDAGLGEFVPLAEDLQGKTPVIYHYTTPRKPWTDHPQVRFREKFLHYAELPWDVAWLKTQGKSTALSLS